MPHEYNASKICMGYWGYSKLRERELQLLFLQSRICSERCKKNKFDVFFMQRIRCLVQSLVKLINSNNVRIIYALFKALFAVTVEITKCDAVQFDGNL